MFQGKCEYICSTYLEWPCPPAVVWYSRTDMSGSTPYPPAYMRPQTLEAWSAISWEWAPGRSSRTRSWYSAMVGGRCGWSSLGCHVSQVWTRSFRFFIQASYCIYRLSRVQSPITGHPNHFLDTVQQESWWPKHRIQYAFLGEVRQLRTRKVWRLETLVWLPSEMVIQEVAVVLAKFCGVTMWNSLKKKATVVCVNNMELPLKPAVWIWKLSNRKITNYN